MLASSLTHLYLELQDSIHSYHLNINSLLRHNAGYPTRLVVGLNYAPPIAQVSLWQPLTTPSLVGTKSRACDMSEAQSSPSGKGSFPDYKYPEVLLRRPRCLIALSGLDVTNNAIHRLVWEEFSSGARRAERKPILFKNFPADHLYPKCGPNVRSLTIWLQN